MFANVLWAANWPYWFWWLPVSTFIGFLAEVSTFHFYQQRRLTWQHSLRLAIFANVASFLGGFIGFQLLAVVLPDNLFMVPQPLGYLPWQSYYVIPLQFLAAYFLSVRIEFGIYRRMCSGHVVHRLAAATFMSNVASYAIIFTGYTLLWVPRFSGPDEWFLSLF